MLTADAAPEDRVEAIAVEVVVIRGAVGKFEAEGEGATAVKDIAIPGAVGALAIKDAVGATVVNVAAILDSAGAAVIEDDVEVTVGVATAVLDDVEAAAIADLGVKDAV